MPGKRELLDGELLEWPPPKLSHSIVQHRIAEALRLYATGRGLLIFVELGFRLGAHGDQRLQPDVSVVMRERIEGADREGDLEGSPLIALEVIIPRRALSGGTRDSGRRRSSETMRSPRHGRQDSRWI